MNKKPIRRILREGLLVVALAGCSPHDAPVTGNPGDPLPGLTPDALVRFSRGKALFSKPFTPEEGLGPLFNQDRCTSCHDLPAAGGTGEESVTKATRFDVAQGCDLLVAEGGDNIQQRATPLLNARGVTHESNPRSANAIASVTPPALFGLGLVEAIPSADLEANADPDDRDGDGVSGRLGRTADGRPARFGRRAEFATVRDFIDTALRFEMGLTTPLHPTEETLGGAALPPETDPAPDPEMDDDEIDLLTDFVRFLVPPAPVVDLQQRDTVARGEALFQRIGCTNCHVPSFRTEENANPALSAKLVQLYSDYLLHDLGPADGSICGHGTTPTEHRTATLVGLRYRVGYLHDGRAGSVQDAILMHAGEANGARDRFAVLDLESQRAVVLFLLSR